ncbi:hypothetical protein A0O28_0013730 [Trichoderma guizhouense]|uniref:Uncharacterized protein n=1 Tax=Trichoderma guizhouense TaxID=1491466 RepID=A0A1T3CB43_9HYPO|nr:hypothetical protein A0O28_0013730 [Trichoderma guizhouense]
MPFVAVFSPTSKPSTPCPLHPGGAPANDPSSSRIMCGPTRWIPPLHCTRTLIAGAVDDGTVHSPTKSTPKSDAPPILRSEKPYRLRRSKTRYSYRVPVKKGDFSSSPRRFASSRKDSRLECWGVNDASGEEEEEEVLCCFGLDFVDVVALANPRIAGIIRGTLAVTWLRIMLVTL